MFIYIRTVLYIDHDGIPRLTDVLSNCLDVGIKRANTENGISQHNLGGHVALNDNEVTVMTNTMKVLFNCTCAANPEENENDEELMSNLSELCRILHLLLTIEKESHDLKIAITR